MENNHTLSQSSKKRGKVAHVKGVGGGGKFKLAPRGEQYGHGSNFILALEIGQNTTGYFC